MHLMFSQLVRAVKVVSVVAVIAMTTAARREPLVNSSQNSVVVLVSDCYFNLSQYVSSHR